MGWWLFATVPESSINSWDSWFIFNLRKINTCYYTNVHCTYIHEEGFRESHIIWLLHYNVIDLLLGCWSTDNVTTTMVFCYKSSWRTVHYLINVRTWAIFFSRHLANVSSMVPLWASTDSGSVPNLGPRVRNHAIRRRLFIVFAGGYL